MWQCPLSNNNKSPMREQNVWKMGGTSGRQEKSLPSALTHPHRAMGCRTLPRVAAPPVPQGIQGVRVLPSRAARRGCPRAMQSWGGLAECPCDQEVASPGLLLHAGLSGRLPSLPTGPGAPGTHHPNRKQMEQAGVPPPPTHTGTAVYPSHECFMGFGGCQQSETPCDRDSRDHPAQLRQPTAGQGVRGGVDLTQPTHPPLRNNSGGPPNTAVRHPLHRYKKPSLVPTPPNPTKHAPMLSPNLTQSLVHCAQQSAYSDSPYSL